MADHAHAFAASSGSSTAPLRTTRVMENFLAPQPLDLHPLDNHSGDLAGGDGARGSSALALGSSASAPSLSPLHDIMRRQMGDLGKRTPLGAAGAAALASSPGTGGSDISGHHRLSSQDQLYSQQALPPSSSAAAAAVLSPSPSSPATLAPLVFSDPERGGAVYRLSAGRRRRRPSRTNDTESYNPITTRFGDEAVEAARRQQEASAASAQVRMAGAYQYESGRVANASIVSKSSPAVFDQQFRHNASYFDGVEDRLRSHWEAKQPKVVPRPNFDRTLEPSWKEVPTWFESPFQSNAERVVDFRVMLENAGTGAYLAPDAAGGGQVVPPSPLAASRTHHGLGIRALRDRIIQRLEQLMRPNAVARAFLSLRHRDQSHVRTMKVPAEGGGHPLAEHQGAREQEAPSRTRCLAPIAEVRQWLGRHVGLSGATAISTSNGAAAGPGDTTTAFGEDGSFYRAAPAEFDALLDLLAEQPGNGGPSAREGGGGRGGGRGEEDGPPGQAGIETTAMLDIDRFVQLFVHSEGRNNASTSSTAGLATTAGGGGGRDIYNQALAAGGSTSGWNETNRGGDDGSFGPDPSGSSQEQQHQPTRGDELGTALSAALRARDTTLRRLFKRHDPHLSGLVPTETMKTVLQYELGLGAEDSDELATLATAAAAHEEESLTSATELATYVRLGVALSSYRYAGV